MSLFDKCRNFERAKELMAKGFYPYFRPIDENNSTRVRINGKDMIMIGSNNYLGLTEHPHVIESARNAIEKYGSSCTGSRFLNGTLDIHVELEDRLAKFLSREAALTFSTGFQANLGTISTLVGKNDVIYCDRENHASIIDGCRLSFGEVRKFKHNDMEDLERLLSYRNDEENGGGKLIAVDGVFSMSGDLCNLPRIVELGKKYDASFFLDDAHSFGVMGANGRGTAEYFHVEDSIDLVMGTFSKSFASIGGFIAGKEEVIHYIKHHSRPHIFSASCPPAAVAACLAALDVIEKEPERRESLHKICDMMRKGFQELGFDTGGSKSAIIPIIIGDQMLTFAFWKELFEEGIFANPVTSPAVPPQKDLIRTSYMATHTEEQMEEVLEIFQKIGRKFGII